LFFVTSGSWIVDRSPRDDNPNLACQVTGRVSGMSSWVLIVQGKDERGGLRFVVGSKGQMRVEGSLQKPELNPTVKMAPITHKALHKGDDWNTLLVIVKDRMLETYANGEAIYDPVKLDRDITPSIILLGHLGGNGSPRAEYKDLIFWPNVDALPPVEKRGAVSLSATASGGN
jgi:hypothetical protein